MKEFQFIKKGITFCFRNPKIDRYDEFKMEYKIKKFHENESNDGFFLGSHLMKDKKAMSFYNVKIKGKKIEGVILPEDVFIEIKKCLLDLTERKNTLKEKFINDLVSGEKNISFYIVGCDFPKYQSWINVPPNLKGSEREIMEKAIKISLDNFTFSTFDIIEKNFSFTKSLKTLDELNELNELKKVIVNVKSDKGKLDYYGLRNGVITSFEVPLSYALKEAKMKLELEKEMINEYNKQAEEMTTIILSKSQNNRDVFSVVRIIDSKTKESKDFICNNIFDFGYIVLPNYSIIEKTDNGILKIENDFWKRIKNGQWVKIRKATDFEIKAINYLNSFHPITSELRM